MWPTRYWPNRFWAPRYWCKVGATSLIHERRREYFSDRVGERSHIPVVPAVF